MHRIAGYAVVYNQMVWHHHQFRMVHDGAFAEMLQKKPRVVLRAWSHDDDADILASTTLGNLRFFSDSFGLGFEAEIDSRHTASVRAIVDGRCARCSGGLIPLSKRMGTYNGETVEFNRRMSLDHVALVPASVFPTAAWSRDIPLDRAVPFVRNMAETWERGRADYDRRRAARLTADRNRIAERARAMTPAQSHTIRASRQPDMVTAGRSAADHDHFLADWTRWWNATGSIAAGQRGAR